MKSRKKKSKKSLWPLWLAVGVFIASFLLIIYLKEASKPTHDFDYSQMATKGDKDAPVHVVEFGDFKCPACQYFALKTLPDISEYIDRGDVQFHFMNFPFIAEDSTRAALFTQTVYEELGDDAFWDMYQRLFLEQKDPSKEHEDYFTEDVLLTLLSDVASEKEVDKVKKAFKDETYLKTISDHLEKARTLGIQSTPSIFVNGKRVDKGNDSDALKEAIERAKKE